MTDKRFNYDEIVQDALRGVVRTVLREVERGGLSGQHHFYIAFRTRMPGVIIPEHLRQRYPEEMTIVLQHRFWGLKVEEDRFSIGLSFNHKPETLVIPFRAVVGIVDPSVQFALQFQQEQAEEPVPETPLSDGASSGDDESMPAGTESPVQSDGAKVVTLDAFRKKP